MLQLLSTWGGVHILDRSVAMAAVVSMLAAVAGRSVPGMIKTWNAPMGGGWALPLPLPLRRQMPSQYVRRQHDPGTVCADGVDMDDL